MPSTLKSNPELSSIRKETDLFWVAMAYLSAIVGAGVALPYLNDIHPLLQLLLVDITATVIIYFFSLGFNNSSMYDAYWSVAPPLLFMFWYGQADSGLLAQAPPHALVRAGIVFMLVSFWAWRLTYNWARSWRGFQHEDFRYVSMRLKFKKAYWPISFLSLHLIPTLFVFLACTPFQAVFSPSIFGHQLNFIDGLAIVLTMGGILLETVADDQRFMASISGKLSPDETFKTGLWSISRHPNYLGEIAFWWGLFLFGMASSPDYWWTFSGALGITLLILLASIPMMENRQLSRKKDYQDYRKRVPMLFPFRSSNGE